ncbi:RNA polymerase sigma-70 factor (ECF subfamily) [Devosia sp. UYZn731]|uniref:RNA polymerase sigma factor n=1 Tax=Devosia sp. UYZn731 TaxID=3156345 RepID=UPI003396BC9F
MPPHHHVSTNVGSLPNPLASTLQAVRRNNDSRKSRVDAPVSAVRILLQDKVGPEAMNEISELDFVGSFDANYRAYLEALRHLRPALQRYCARMVGSMLDGEDIAQEVVFEAYSKRQQFDETRPLRPWLFRIAHNRSIDFLRRRGSDVVRIGLFDVDAIVQPIEPVGKGLDRAIERMITALPPMERACVLLKDVLDYSLGEAAQILDTSEGGVKSALHRGRTKLATLADKPASYFAHSQDVALIEKYIDRFNNQDWDGLRDMIAADAKLRVADHFAGPLNDAPYLGWYSDSSRSFGAELGHIEDEPVVSIHMLRDGAWTLYAAVRLVGGKDGLIGQVRDFSMMPWMLGQVAAARRFDLGR